ncbi:MAG: hypothetical protein R3E96_03580 [Planctomycetota bacterium]
MGGNILLLPHQDHRPFAKYAVGPQQTRSLIDSRGREQSVAFQTRNPPHRAHEYALRTAPRASCAPPARKPAWC